MIATNQSFLFDDLGSRQVQADFSGGILSTDAGALLLRQVDVNLGLTAELAQCFCDERNPVWVDHSVQELLRQRIFGTALGYEDINDHQRLRLDPLLAAACGKTDPLGEHRVLPQHRGVALAAPSTLNRLELSNNKDTRCHKVPHNPAKVEACLLKMGARCLPKHAREIVLDLDAMGHRLHGLQEGRRFNAYYDDYCYLPLYAFVGDFPLWAQLRTAEHEAAHGAVPALEKIVAAIRKRCRRARIIVRGDSGFGREEIMAWCENQREVYYCLGLAKNSVLIEKLGPALAQARARHCLTGAASVREFAEFEYRTHNSWSRSRRVIGKAEVMNAGENPRFLVTNLPAKGFPDDKDKSRFSPARLYEELYCARGEMENLLKQQVLDLRADRMSTHYEASNQFRLWEAMFAYLLLERLRTQGLTGTELERATAGSLRLKLLKIAAQVRVSVRRVYVQMSSAFPLQALFGLCHRRLMRLAEPAG
jgi:hypothetical protein